MSRAPFVLGSVGGAAMIVNRLDYDPKELYRGVGLDLLEDGHRDLKLLEALYRLLEARRTAFGDGVVVIDGGANIGSVTVPLARHVDGWGRVIAFEPQQWPFYALCGNLALNNCFNAAAHRKALGAAVAEIPVPFLHPNEPHNFGGLQLGKSGDLVPLITIDSLKLPRVDLIKLDLESMEPFAIRGARNTIFEQRPIIIAETTFCGSGAITNLLPDYRVAEFEQNLICEFISP